MVEYATWVSIVRSTAGRKGADLSDFETNSEIVSLAASVWNDRNPELQGATKGEARGIADSEVSVR